MRLKKEMGSNTWEEEKEEEQKTKRREEKAYEKYPFLHFAEPVVLLLLAWWELGDRW
jgi:hypothetical protein